MNFLILPPVQIVIDIHQFSLYQLIAEESVDVKHRELEKSSIDYLKMKVSEAEERSSQKLTGKISEPMFDSEVPFFYVHFDFFKLPVAPVVLGCIVKKVVILRCFQSLLKEEG